jgi:membrane-associated phospholipid phosphatase
MILDNTIKKFIIFFYAIGFFSEFIALFLVLIVLFNRRIDLLVYFIGLFINVIINVCLKRVFKSLRPNDPIKFLNEESFKGKKYGMPSGHSQNVFYSIAYIYLGTNYHYIYWCIIGFVLAVLMMYERWSFHNHTLAQLVVGAIVGITVAYYTLWIKNKILSKI